MTRKTALGEVRGLGSARGGTKHFWLERVTSVALVPLTVALVFVILVLLQTPPTNAAAALSSPPVALLFLLFIVTGMVHTRIGMNVIIEDYIHHHKLKIAALVLNTFFCVLVGAASALAVLKLFLGR